MFSTHNSQQTTWTWQRERAGGADMTITGGTLAMLPTTVNLELYGGDENAFGVEVMVDGVPADITGWEFQAQARLKVTDVEPAATATCDVVGGAVQVVWGDLHALLAGSAVWTGVWDLQVVRPGTTYPKTLIAGRMNVTLDVTREAP